MAPSRQRTAAPSAGEELAAWPKTPGPRSLPRRARTGQPRRKTARRSLGDAKPEAPRDAVRPRVWASVRGGRRERTRRLHPRSQQHRSQSQEADASKTTTGRGRTKRGTYEGRRMTGHPKGGLPRRATRLNPEDTALRENDKAARARSRGRLSRRPGQRRGGGGRGCGRADWGHGAGLSG